MLLVVFHNDGTGNEIDGNYDVDVYINKEKIWTGRIENHNRLTGWQGLVKCLSRKVWKGEYE